MRKNMISKVKTIIREILIKLKIVLIKDLIDGILARHYLAKNRPENREHTKMRVAFIVYEPSMWDKLEPIYNEFKIRTDTEVFLVVVPAINVLNEMDKTAKMDFFNEKYENVLSYNESFDIKKERFDYVFFQTPYNKKFPPKLRPEIVVRYSKICYVPYAYIGSNDFSNVSSAKSFFRYVYFGFLDSEPMQEILCNKFGRECSKGLQYFEFLGYPALEYYINIKPQKDSVENILWTPRWSYAEIGGGSHFIEYKENLVEYKNNNPKLNVKIRPHPLMFSSFVEQGLLSEQEVKEYKCRLVNSNISLDESSLLNETLKDTDVLISDYSSILINFFLSGKPIIYCDSDIEFSGMYQQLKDCFYIANSWGDVENYMSQLVKGIDPLKKKRIKLIEESFENHVGATRRIVDRILLDFRGNSN